MGKFFPFLTSWSQTSLSLKVSDPGHEPVLNNTNLWQLSLINKSITEPKLEKSPEIIEWISEVRVFENFHRRISSSSACSFLGVCLIPNISIP